MNREISADFMAELLSGIEHSPGRREELLRSALEYNAENSDALYYLGRKRIREGRVLDAEDLIRRALESEDWLFTPPVDAIAEHVDLLLRLKRFDTIRSRYVASDRWVEFLNNPGILIDLIDALYRMGDHGLADQIMNRARARYPDDMRLRALAVTRPDPPLIGDYQWLKAVWAVHS
jgi:tetratricopeptide (TPR) repeat protein